MDVSIIIRPEHSDYAAMVISNKQNCESMCEEKCITGDFMIIQIIRLWLFTKPCNTKTTDRC